MEQHGISHSFARINFNAQYVQQILQMHKQVSFASLKLEDCVHAAQPFSISGSCAKIFQDSKNIFISLENYEAKGSLKLRTLEMSAVMKDKGLPGSRVTEMRTPDFKRLLRGEASLCIPLPQKVLKARGLSLLWQRSSTSGPECIFQPGSPHFTLLPTGPQHSLVAKHCFVVQFLFVSATIPSWGQCYLKLM